MQLNAQQKRLALIALLVLLGVTILAIVLIRINNIRTLRTSLTTQNSANLNPSSLVALQNMWPLAVSPEAGVYGFLCAVSEIVEEPNGRALTEKLQSIFSVNCQYLAADGSVQTLLIPLAFHHNQNGEVNTIIYNYEPVPAMMRSDEIRMMLERTYNLVPGKVMLVNFNFVNPQNSQLLLSDYLSSEIPQVINESKALEFSRTGQAGVFEGSFIPRLITFDSFIGPQTIK